MAGAAGGGSGRETGVTEACREGLDEVDASERAVVCGAADEDEENSWYVMLVSVFFCTERDSVST